jgi:hypothetical protein
MNTETAPSYLIEAQVELDARLASHQCLLDELMATSRAGLSIAAIMQALNESASLFDAAKHNLDRAKFRRDVERYESKWGRLVIQPNY